MPPETVLVLVARGKSSSSSQRRRKGPAERFASTRRPSMGAPEVGLERARELGSPARPGLRKELVGRVERRPAAASRELEKSASRCTRRRT